MTSAIDSTLGGGTTNGVSIDKTELQTALAAAASEITALQASLDNNTWTPVLIAASGSTWTYTRQYGIYQKVGNWVLLQGRLTINDIGDASGNLSIGGLPFTSVANTNAGGPVFYAQSLGLAAASTISLFMNGAVSTASLQVHDATTGTTAMQASELTSGGDLGFNLSYPIA